MVGSVIFFFLQSKIKSLGSRVQNRVGRSAVLSFFCNPEKSLGSGAKTRVGRVTENKDIIMLGLTNLNLTFLTH